MVLTVGHNFVFLCMELLYMQCFITVFSLLLKKIKYPINYFAAFHSIVLYCMYYLPRHRSNGLSANARQASKGCEFHNMETYFNKKQGQNSKVGSIPI